MTEAVTEPDMSPAALSHHADGWPLVHVRLRPSFQPYITDWRNKPLRTPEEIERAWRATPNAAICGLTGSPSGRVVLDVDSVEGHGVDGFASFAELTREHGLPDTRAHQTPSGGMHYVFSLADGGTLPTVTGLLRGVDFKGEGGLVVLPPSVRGGKSYFVVDPRPPAPVPEWLRALVLGRKLPVPVSEAGHKVFRSVSAASAYAEAALNGEVDAVANAVTGTRNDRLNLSSFRLGRLVGAGLLPPGLVQSELERAGEACGLDAREVRRTIRSGLINGMAQPISVEVKGAR